MPPPTATDPWRSCRFCLRDNNAAVMRSLPQNDLLPHTEVAQLFEEVTGSPLDLSPGFSELLCADCEQRLRTAAQIRADLLSVAQRWQEILLDSSSVVVKTELSGADDDMVHMNTLYSSGGVFDTVFVNCNAPMEDALLQKEREHERPTNVQLQADWGAPPPGELLTCDICGRKWASRRSLVRHMATKHGPIGGQTCKICGKTFIRLTAWHMRIHHRPGILYQCSQCDKTFEKRRYMVEHERHHERKAKGERRPYVCDICGFVFACLQGLRRHRLSNHANNATDATTTSSSIKLLRKQQIFREPVADDKVAPTIKMNKCLPTPVNGRIECPICVNSSKLYSNRSTLKAHVRYTHGPDGLPEWKRYLATVCVVCNERCSDARALREHRRVHQPFECEICKQTFDTRVTWEPHTKNHADVKRPHICYICQARYTSPYRLRLHHRRVHTDERPYQCDQCNVSFTAMTSLRKHIFLHSGKQRKSYVCRECPADAPPFTSQQTLRKHMEIHTGECRYRCQVCSMRQSTVVRLLEHMRQFHPEDLKDAVL